MTLVRKTSIAVVSSQEELNKKLKITIRNIEKELRRLYGGAYQGVPVYKTSGSFKYNELDSNTVNIITCSDLNYLTKAYTKLWRLNRDHQEAMQEIGLTNYPVLIWYGASVEDWLHDIASRINLVANGARIKELEQAKTDLSTFLSTEDRLFNTLEKLSKTLKKQ